MAFLDIDSTQMFLYAAKMSSVGAFTLLTSRFLKSRHFDPTIYTCAKNREVSVSRNFAIFLVGIAHVRSQATVHAFMHAAHAVCMRAEDIDTRFKEREELAVRKYPRSRDEKSRHFSVTIYTG